MSDPTVELPSEAVALRSFGASPSEAKDKAVSDLTAACYQKASMLQLSKEEVSALSADFADEAFQPGAAGKENLIYIEHAALRERLDSVIGMGQWAIVPIKRWVEDFEYEKDVWENNRRTGQKVKVIGKNVYADCIMLIRGCFVASAIGDMVYYPDNHTQNYGDAVEGAETAALRRCCKRLGVGLQAWRKDWCLAWWQRKNAGQRKPTPAPVKPQAATKVAPPKANAASRMQALNQLQAAPGQPNRDTVTSFLMYRGWLGIANDPETWLFAHVPTTKEELTSLAAAIQTWDESRHQPATTEELI